MWRAPTRRGGGHVGPGPGGALLVGIATAKSLALGWGIPVVGVNHLEGHLASVFLADRDVPFPQTALLVSGGHCMLTRSTAPGSYELLGETVDDSIGEAYDKVARYLGLGYPGGPVLDRLAGTGEDVLGFPPAHAGRGLRLLVLGAQDRGRQLRPRRPRLLETRRGGVLRGRLHGRADRQAPPGTPGVRRPRAGHRGGVAASPILRARAQALADEFGTRLLIPPHAMATDNAAMIGVAGWHKLARWVPAEPAFGPEPDLRLRFV